MSVDEGARGGAAYFVVAADHPALAGHFPGEPVVPGVVVLDHVLELVGAGCDAPRSLAWVKFARPLLPDQQAQVQWTVSGTNLRFTVSHDGAELARGLLAGVAP
jgi:3-hydroxymyristoyl/3-hydroxydecanoyl-(acyl carrier protein) dehydratase